MKIIESQHLPADFFQTVEFQEVEIVREIIREVRQRGDAAIRKYTQKFDGVELETFSVEKPSLSKLKKHIPPDLQQAITFAADNIRIFSEKQKSQFQDFEFPIQPGVLTGQKITPVQSAGVYIPGGRYPLFSTVLMTVIPARVAGVKRIVLCSPPTSEGKLHPYILYAGLVAGVDEFYAVGGVQAIAALAYGTETIAPVDVIVGPGNKYVTLAKKEVFGQVGIDFIAGPTEVLIIADDSANPQLLAADLLAQAEHDAEAQPILVTTSRKIATETINAIEVQLVSLKTAATAREALRRNGVIILVSHLSKAAKIANQKAPEHLEIQVAHPEKIVPLLKNFGTLFIGESSAEVLGDYSSGINHTLPTNRAARYTGGLSVSHFLKIQTTLRVEKNGLQEIGQAAERMAEAEGLLAHRNAIYLRRKENH